MKFIIAMRKNLLLLCLLMLAGLTGFGQAKFDSVSVTNFKNAYKLDSDAHFFINFNNTGNKTYKGYVSFYYKTNHSKSKSIFLATTFPFYFNIAAGDSFAKYPYNYGWQLQINIDSPNFRVGPDNIVVVWPTGNGVTTSDSFKTTITVSVYTAIEKMDEPSIHIRFYPNPAKDVVHFDVPVNTPLIRKIEIFDMSGKAQSNWSYTANQIDAGNLPVGTYIAQFRFADGTIGKYKIIRGLTAN